MKSNSSNLRAIRLCYSFSPSYFPLMILNAILSVLGPYYNLYLSAEIVNEITGSKNIKIIVVLVIITVLGNFLISILGGLITRCLSHSAKKMEQAESRYYMQKILSMNYADLETPNVRQLRRKISESSRVNCHGKQLLLKSIERIVNNIVSVVVALCLFAELFFKSFSTDSWYFTLFFYIIITVLIMINIIYNLKIKNKNAAALNSVSQSMMENNRVEDAVDCYNMGKDVRLYRLAPIIMGIREQSRVAHRKAFEAFSMYQLKSGVPLLILTTCLNIIVYIYVVFHAIKGAFGVGSIIKYVGLSQKLIECIMGIFRGVADLKANTVFIKDYLAYFDIQSMIQDGRQTLPEKSLQRSGGKDIIEFRNVSFKYPMSNVFALKDINLTIKSGERLGFVGQNGSGKTTFIKLLCRLYDPIEGEILLNGVNIKKYNFQEYLSLLSVVFQDFKLFSFSLAENISASEKYNSSLIKECLSKVGLEKRLKNMPKGIQSYLYKDFDENGIEISGGEAQKIALARALYKNAPIFIFDEPTASLDPLAEMEFYSKINNVIGKKTAIYISHRLSFCRYCDVIAVFDEGKIIQYGKHEDLLSNKDGKYYTLWSAQAQYYLS